MHPILFELGNFPIRSFGVMVAIGFLVATQWLWPKLLRRYGSDPVHDPERSYSVSFWILVGVLLGGRLMYVGVEVARYLGGATGERSFGARVLEYPWEAFYLWQGGMAMYGGFAGAVLLGLWAANRAGMRPLPALDTGLVCGFVGQAIGRVGCLLVGDDYGRVVPERFANLPFPIVLRVPSLEWLENNTESLFEHHLADQVLWATQPWMSAKALLVAAIGLWMLRRRRYHGQVSLTIGLSYALLRFGIEFFRGDSIRGLWFDGLLSTSQLISIPLALVCAFGLWRGRGRVDPELRAPLGEPAAPPAGPKAPRRGGPSKP